MKDRAYAKINLSLDVFNIREDGYHDIRSIMVPIDFYDELEIKIAKENYYWCNKSYIKFNDNNSIIKMINILKDRFGINDSYEIRLNKYVPTKAGLGGGTADGAGVLRIFERLYKLDLSEEEKKEICLMVGADVPFNYFNYPALVSGIGDEIERINILKEYYVLIVKPKLGVSTKQAYELLDMNKCDHPDIDRLKLALEKGESIEGLLGNSLEQPSMLLNSEIEVIKNKMVDCGGVNILMSGSGSAVFCIDEDKDRIKKMHELFLNSKYYVRFTKTLNR